jgi:hypothetical protein
MWTGFQGTQAFERRPRLAKRQLERPDSGGRDLADRDLVVAARRIHGQSSADANGPAVRQVEDEPLDVGLAEHRSHLGRVGIEHEVECVDRSRAKFETSVSTATSANPDPRPPRCRPSAPRPTQAPARTGLRRGRTAGASTSGRFPSPG